MIPEISSRFVQHQSKADSISNVYLITNNALMVSLPEKRSTWFIDAIS